MGGKRFSPRNRTVVTVKRIIGLGPENRIVICIEAVGAHYYFMISSWGFGDESLIRSGDKIFSVEEESPDFAIHRTNGPCKNTFSRQAIANSILQHTIISSQPQQIIIHKHSSHFDAFLLAMRILLSTSKRGTGKGLQMM